MVYHEGMTNTHTCTVRSTSFTNSEGTVTFWWVDCPTCGPVGGSESFEVDAAVIAERHADQGGFERRVAQ